MVSMEILEVGFLLRWVIFSLQVTAGICGVFYYYYLARTKGIALISRNERQILKIISRRIDLVNGNLAFTQFSRAHLLH